MTLQGYYHYTESFNCLVPLSVMLVLTNPVISFMYGILANLIQDLKKKGKKTTVAE